MLESVQQRATKLLDCIAIASLSYEERLKFLNLYSIEDRLKRGDMILMYKIMNNDLNIYIDRDDRERSLILFPVLKETNTRGDHLKIDRSSWKACPPRWVNILVGVTGKG